MLNNQLSLTDEAIGNMESLLLFLASTFASFFEPSGPHYDATLADYIKRMRAKKFDRMSRVRVSRVRL